MTQNTDIIVDCDIHANINRPYVLLPYLDDYWREHFEARFFPGNLLNLTSSPPNAPLSVRPDWKPTEGLPAGKVEQVSKGALDAFGTDIGILNPVGFAQIMHSEDMAAVMCRAINDMIAKEWLDRDPRLRASILVPATQSPHLAVEEIERRASDKRFVQVLMLSQNETPVGKRYYWPIYEAAQKHGLTVCIHAGSAYRHAPSYTGYPAYFVEEYALQAAGFKTALLSLVAEGALGKFPDLKFVLAESGFTWLPAFMWRTDKSWRGVRREVPWVTEAPSELIKRQVRFTLQPVDAPDNDPQPIEQIIEQIGCDDILLFATDFPHWHFDGTDAFPKSFPTGLKKRIQTDNPLATYPRIRQGARQEKVIA